MFCISKGLCAPIGSLIVGNKKFIMKAKKNRKLMGGGLRQVGFLGAAGLVALKDMVKRLKVDHDNALYLASQLDSFENITVIRERLDINMVFFTMNDTVINEQKFISKLLEKNIKINGIECGEYRFVTNNDVSKDDIDYVIKCMHEII